MIKHRSIRPTRIILLPYLRRAKGFVGGALQVRVLSIPLTVYTLTHTHTNTHTQLTVGSGVHLGEELARGIVRAKCLSVLVNGVEVIIYIYI